MAINTVQGKKLLVRSTLDGPIGKPIVGGFEKKSNKSLKICLRKQKVTFLFNTSKMLFSTKKIMTI